MTIADSAAPLSLTEGRFSRFERIEWWDQAKVLNARVLVVGAGALGNEVVKNLALLGVGHLLIVDMDHVEVSNVTRSVLFRESDAGLPKAECAARSARDLYPIIDARAITGSVSSDLGLGHFRWADVVVGAVDNREARIFINAACARVGRVWIDGGIEVLHGVVRVFAPPQTPCYECTMSEIDWQVVNTRRSCSMLARRALQHGGTPTTPTTASIIGAMQAQEVVKILHSLPSIAGRGFHYDGVTHDSYSVAYQVDPNCPWHDEASPLEILSDVDSDTPLTVVLDRAAKILGGVDALDLSREIVESLECVRCGGLREILQPIDSVVEEEARCPRCEADAVPHFLHSVVPGSRLAALTPRQLGLPSRDIVWARFGERGLGLELGGDAAIEERA